jgi:ParB-like chromosome segregation protein Spo0J
MVDYFKKELKRIFEGFEVLDIEQKIEILNTVKVFMHKISPMKSEPVDCVLWVKNDTVHANDYNPNSVAPPEMELLRLSISSDGYTQPIVSMLEENGETREVIDGFHRNRVGKECEEIQSRIHGYLPVVTINEDRTKINDRVASTIRHNRARGKHKIDAMSDIVIDLKKRNWSDSKIAKNLGMDADEVLRLCQIGGLVELFSDKDFSKAWEAETYSDEEIN